jgi:hypothetical protein
MEKSSLILPVEYLMGRDREYLLDAFQLRNMADLLSRVNWLLATLNWKTHVTSGYRPSTLNKTVGGAKMSTHTVCAGIDLAGNELAKELKRNPQLLEESGLYLEHPDFTVGNAGGWTHLDIKQRKNRIFQP